MNDTETKPATAVTPEQFAIALTIRDQYDSALKSLDRKRIAATVNLARIVGQGLYNHAEPTWYKPELALWTNTALGIETYEEGVEV